MTPAPANPDTRVSSFKSTDLNVEVEPTPVFTPDAARLRDQVRDDMMNLLVRDNERGTPLEREEKLQSRELRRRCDRLQLEAALGFDDELLALIDEEDAT